MKKGFCACLLFLAFCAKAQTDTSELEMDSVEIVFAKLPDSTAIGTPDGKLVSKEIGPSGGTIISDDGKVQLNFPAGAIEASIVISVQPITNLIPNGNGKAYKFEPSGIRFSKPVEIIFHYSKEEEEVCPPDLKFMALQSSDGKWEYMNYEDWDSTTRSLKGFISHFSAVLDGNLIELSTVDATLKVQESLGLTLNIVVSPGEDELPLLPPKPNSPEGKRQVKWSVEGVGKISQRGNRYGAVYTAPKYLPQGNAKVILKINEKTIREVVQRSGKWRGTTWVPTKKNLATFTCNIKLYDEYKITISKKGASGLICGAELEDKSIFEVKLYPNNKRPDLSEPINALPTLTKQANCGYVKYDPGDCQGPVHVSKALLFGYGILYDQGAITAPEITLEFAVRGVKIMNKKDRAPNELHDFPADVIGVTVGNMIKFKANRLRQDISVGGSGQMSYQLIIDPL